MKMKFILGAAVAAFMVAVGCTKENVQLAPAQEITMSPYYTTSVATKADDNEHSFATTETFVTKVYYDDSKDENGVYVPESVVKYTDQWRAYNNEDVMMHYYWPVDGKKLTFYSYYPASLKSQENAPKAWITSVGVNAEFTSRPEVDFMVADTQCGQTANSSNDNYTGVPTIFRHALAKIETVHLKLQGAPYNSLSYKVMYVKLTGLKNGTYTQSGESHWKLSENDEYSENDGYSEFLYNNKDGLEINKKDGGSFNVNKFFIPGNNFNITVGFEVTGSNNIVQKFEKTASVENLSMQENYNYTLNITRGSDNDKPVNEILWAPSVKDWIDDTISVTL